MILALAALALITGGTVTTTATGPEAGPRPAIGGRDVFMHATTIQEYGALPPAADRLKDQALLRITAVGFDANSVGVVEQCSVAGCANPFPVVFDASGIARVQYLAGQTFAADFERPSTCRADALPCVVRLRSNDDSAYLTTVFRDAAPRPRRVIVDPSAGGLVDGARVRVAVEGFVPGEEVEAMLCAAPDTYGSRRCSAPGLSSPFTIDADGTGRTAMVVRQGRLGSIGAACGRGAQCGIVVSPPGSSVPAPVIPIVFAAGPGAEYEAARVAIGLSVAALLAAIAVFVARRTDWRKPTEADTPDLDHVVLNG